MTPAEFRVLKARIDAELLELEQADRDYRAWLDDWRRRRAAARRQAAAETERA